MEWKIVKLMAWCTEEQKCLGWCPHSGVSGSTACLDDGYPLHGLGKRHSHKPSLRTAVGPSFLWWHSFHSVPSVAEENIEIMLKHPQARTEKENQTFSRNLSQGDCEELSLVPVLKWLSCQTRCIVLASTYFMFCSCSLQLVLSLQWMWGTECWSLTPRYWHLSELIKCGWADLIDRWCIHRAGEGGH